MRLPKAPIVSGTLPGQVRQIGSYLVQQSRALEAELEALRKAVKDRGLSMEEIVEGVLASERVLDTIYKYCEKRRQKEENDGTSA